MPRLWLGVVFCASAAAAFGAQGTSVSLALTSGSPIYGVTLEFSATVKAAIAGTPTGMVTFTIDGFTTTPQPMDPRGVATIPHSFFPGAHTITAAYLGNENFSGSSTAAPLTIQVSKAGTSIAMASNPPQIGQAVAIRAAVTLEAGSGAPGGTVDFAIAGAAISGCTGLRVSNGVAICNATFAAVGNFTVTASYSGDGNTSGSAGSLPMTVGKVVAGIYIAASPETSSWGQLLTVNALLIGAQDVAAPTGTVTFSDGGKVIGTQAVGADGRASVTPWLPAGSHTLTASYAGDANYQASTTKAPASVTVAKAATTLSLSGYTAGLTGVTLNALLSAPGKVTGTVAFSVVGGGAIAGCTAVSVNGKVAFCSGSLQSLGTVTVRADYSGDENTNASSATLTLTAKKLTPGVYLAAQPEAPYYGQTVTVGALALGAAGFAIPTGTVTITEGATTSATQALDKDGHAAFPKQYAVGTHTITVSYSGDANYLSSSAAGTPAPLTLVVVKADSNVAVAATPAQIGQTVTIRAVVSLTTSSAITGTIDFMAGAQPIDGCTKLAVQSGAATCNTKFAQLGNYAIAASYSGDANINASTASMQLTVGKVLASVYLNSTPDAPVFGVPVTMNALVLGAEGAPGVTGSVTFTDGSTNLGMTPLGSDGRGSMVLRPSPGTHTIGASYGGDSNYQCATASTRTITVSKAATTTSLSGTAGAPMTAIVTVDAPGAGVPSGVVQFVRGGAVLASAPLIGQNGMFSATWASPQVGSIYAMYLGDGNFTGSTSAPVQMTLPAPRVIVTSDRNPVHPGDMVTFTITVAPASNALTTTPTGTVTLLADGNRLGASPLDAGQTTFHATFDKGTHAIAAQYSGDAMFAAGSGTYSLTASVDAASLSVTSSLAVTWFGQPVTFTAKLGSAASGTVQFSEGATLIGSALLSAGVAALTVADLPPGTHAITASWPGDTNWGAASAQFVQTVSRANTVTACLFANGAIRAVVSAVSPGAGSPTGTVSFVDTITNGVLATAAVNGGTATAAPASAPNPIAAVYSGDSNFFGSTSAPASQLAVVNAASYARLSVAPDEIVTMFAQDLASSVSVTITDGAGVSRTAPLLFVSPGQASVLMPTELAPGPGTIRVTRSSGVVLAVPVAVTLAAPGLFTVDGSGEGTPAAQIIRVHADGSRDAAVQVTDAIDLADGDSAYLVLYGTGIRHSAAMPVCKIAGQTVAVQYAGAQGSFAGLDQVNVQLPAGLNGVVKLSLTVDGVESNAVTLSFR